jgi:acetyl-CoA/propionyl-CoA carboxylase, biotin carboxylase, biotin carboxyl carrier protein
VAVKRLLVANRGEIARRIFRTARRMGIETVALYGPPDRNAPHVREADLAIALDDAMGFLAIDAVVDAARLAGADAIHPGYGFRSEDPALALAVTGAGMTWVGPPAPAMRAMSRKDDAKRIARVCDVPILEGSDRYPLLVKAAAGGGGRGMRIVRDPARLDDAREAAEREALASFGDGTLLIEPYVERGRHVEVQVIADHFGTVLHLGTRDCSVQRRHQKVIEEAPAPDLPDALRASLHGWAVRLAAHIEYTNAGTCEFLVDTATGEAYFLEMNTRLQVEHPVTEAVCGVDLVELQLRIARGERLFITQDDVRTHGHAIEARLCAEDPANGYLPSVGTVWHCAWPSEARVDSTVEIGSAVTPDYDSMIAKVITSAATRSEAVAALRHAMQRVEIGGVTTNRSMIVHALDAIADTAALSTALLDEKPILLQATDEAPLHASALDLLLAHRRRHPFAPIGFRVVHGDRNPEPTVEEIDDHHVAITVDGVRHRFAVRSSGTTHLVVDGLGNQAVITEASRFPEVDVDRAAHGPQAPLPGSVLAVEVDIGQRVTAGQLLVVIEAMKMEHRITASHDAEVVAVLVAPGDKVDAHQLLVELSES